MRQPGLAVDDPIPSFGIWVHVDHVLRPTVGLFDLDGIGIVVFSLWSAAGRLLDHVSQRAPIFFPEGYRGNGGWPDLEGLNRIGAAASGGAVTRPR
jgi:hypothetical protein